MKKFEIGKFYKHASGKKVYICGLVETKFYGVGYLAEYDIDKYGIFGMREENTIGWTEIKESQWNS